MWDKVQDSGKRQEFTTGSKRDVKDGKGSYHLLPLIAIRRLAMHFQNGAKKYGEHNWRLGQPLMAGYFDSAMRHMFCWAMGWEDEDHLAAAIWNLCCLLETLELIKRGKLPQELDDRVEQCQDDYTFVKEAQETQKLDRLAPTTYTVNYDQHVSTGDPINIICSGQYFPFRDMD